MNFAMIIDGCVQKSYYVKDGKSYRFETDEPYSHHHSIGNECHLGLWGWPFLFNGYFLNWTEFDELPALDLDIIVVAIEKNPNYNVDILRKRYPNATIVSFVKESHWIHLTVQQRLEFFKSCDYNTFPWEINYDIEGGINGIKTLSDLLGREVHYLPYPHNVQYLHNKYYKQDRDKKILAYKAGDNRGQSIDFVDHIAKKYGLEVFQHIVKYKGEEHRQWEEFLDGITSAMYCFNLSDRVYGGTMAVQCAALGILNIGGREDSHKTLWERTYTNDLLVLEHEFVDTFLDESCYVDTIQKAYSNSISTYSHNAVKNRILDIINK